LLGKALNYLINSGEDPLKGYLMATKKEIFETVTNEATALCNEHKVPTKFREALMNALSVNLAPKAGGATVNVDEVTKKDESGKVTEILCSVSGKWLPATKEFRKSHIKTLSATEKAIMSDVLDGKMTPEQGKTRLEKAKSVNPDYSGVTAKLPKEA